MSAIFCKNLSQLKHPGLIKFHQKYSAQQLSDYVKRSAARSLSSITGNHAMVCCDGFQWSSLFGTMS